MKVRMEVDFKFKLGNITGFLKLWTNWLPYLTCQLYRFILLDLITISKLFVFFLFVESMGSKVIAW